MFKQTNFNVDSASAYKTKIDGDFAALAKLANQFYPHIMPEPVVETVAGGALPQRTYYVKFTFHDTGTPSESTPSPEVSIVVPANNLLKVKAPLPMAKAGATPLDVFDSWNVYVSTAAGTETKQNTANMTRGYLDGTNINNFAAGADWTEPTSGLIAGAALPANSLMVVIDGGRLYTAYTTAPAIYDYVGTAIVLNLAAADATNPRIDRTRFSATVGSVTTDTGTPAATPVPPAFNASNLPCARIYVPANATTLVDSNITDERALWTKP